MVLLYWAGAANPSSEELVKSPIVARNIQSRSSGPLVWAVIRKSYKPTNTIVVITIYGAHSSKPLREDSGPTQGP